jgi:putative nucleotidyltransferase-like protein
LRVTNSNLSRPRPAPLSPEIAAFYRHAMAVLEQAGIPFLVGGAYAFAHYTGIVRDTKDFDLFILPRDFDAALAALAAAGYPVERNFPHWLGKAHGAGGSFVDLIFGSGNGLTRVDEGWFGHARRGEVLGVQVRLCPPEEMLWSKAFIMERERYDGADVAHLLHCCAEELDWQRLLTRFGEHWRVLLSHLVLFGYIYPAQPANTASAKHPPGAARVPAAVMETLVGRLSRETFEPAAGAEGTAGDAVNGASGANADPLCRGTILSRAQYLSDIATHGYLDARLPPSGTMSPEQVEQWTAAIEDDG